MMVKIVTQPLSLILYGLSGTVEDKNYARTGKQLMDALWEEIAAQKLPHKGINHWVYESETSLFVGVEFEGAYQTIPKLLVKEMYLPQYIYWKHIGPVDGLGKAYEDIYKDLVSKDIQTGFPKLEIYGHWTEDVSKFETEIIIALA